jgi:anion-transporting  ArsA/GET3 family ATPase
VKGILDRKLLFVTGKGGVGKTTVAAAMGLCAARRGKRVLVVEIDTDPAMQRLFGSSRIGFDPVQVATNLWACNLEGRACMQAFVKKTVRSDRVSELILGNKIVGVFFESAPSVVEAVILDQIAIRTTETTPAYDLVIVDLPASGHAVTFLRVPRSMAEMVSVGELAGHLRSIDALLSHPDKSGLVLVTLPEEMPTTETIELSRNIERRVTTPVCAVVVNALKDSGIDETDVAWMDEQLGTAEDRDREALRRLRYGVALAKYWEDEEQEQHHRLRGELGVKLIDTPYVFTRSSEQELVERVARRLSEQL